MPDLAVTLGPATMWVKAAHIIFVIFLMAGLFMMPRFFVYQLQCPVGSAEDKAWTERCDRLRRIILNPSLVIVWVLGLVLAANGNLWLQGWFLAKLALVLALSGYHGWLIAIFKQMARGERRVSERRMRLLNEVPGLAAALIVVLAVVRPF